MKELKLLHESFVRFAQRSTLSDLLQGLVGSYAVFSHEKGDDKSCRSRFPHGAENGQTPIVQASVCREKKDAEQGMMIKDLPMHKNTSARIETILYKLVRLWEMFK